MLIQLKDRHLSLVTMSQKNEKKRGKEGATSIFHLYPPIRLSLPPSRDLILSSSLDGRKGRKKQRDTVGGTKRVGRTTIRSPHTAYGTIVNQTFGFDDK